MIKDLQILVCQYLVHDTGNIDVRNPVFHEAARREFKLFDYSTQEIDDFLTISSLSLVEGIRRKLSIKPIIHFISKTEPTNELLIVSAEYGNIECLSYLLSIFKPFNHRECFLAALKGGHCDCFQLIHKYAEYPADSIFLCVGYNQEEILKYLLEYYNSDHCRTEAFYYSITSNKLNLLKLLFPYTEASMNYGLMLAATDKVDYQIFLYLSPRYNGSYYSCFMKACEYGRLDIIQHIFNTGKSDDLSLELGMRYASRGGYIDIIKFLRLRGCEFDTEAFSVAVSSNFPNIVEYFLINGYRKDLEQELVNACSRSMIKIVNLLIPYLQSSYMGLIKRYGSQECLSFFHK